MEFSRNCENKHFHETQSAYFGHEAFTIFTSACYYHCLDNENNDNNDDDDTSLKVGITIAVVNHERNMAFTCNQKIIKMVWNHIDRAINTVYNWSDGCASQFCSQCFSQNVILYPRLKNILGLW